MTTDDVLNELRSIRDAHGTGTAVVDRECEPAKVWTVCDEAIREIGALVGERQTARREIEVLRTRLHVEVNHIDALNQKECDMMRQIIRGDADA